MASRPDLSFLKGLGIPNVPQSTPIDAVLAGEQSTLAAVLQHYGQLFVDSTKRNLEQRHGNASFKLFDSIAADIQIVGLNFRFTILMEDYWQFKDEGRSPGKKPPLKPIIDWIFNKHDFKAAVGATRTGLKSMKMAKFGDISAPAAILSAAIGIQNKIGKYGTKPSNFVADVLTEEAIGFLRADLAAAVGRDVLITINQIKNEINGDNNRPRTANI